MDDSMTSRDFLCALAAKIKKKPSDVERFIVALEENWIETVGAMREIDDDQWKQLGIPLGLLNQIKNALTSKEVLPTAPAAEKKEDEEMQIETKVIKKEAVPTLRIDLGEEAKQQSEKKEAADDMPAYLKCLTTLQERLARVPDGKQMHQASVKTLHKVIENIAVNPAEDKYLVLPKTNKGVQEKILAHPEALSFLQLVGFDFADATQAKLHAPSQEKLALALDAIRVHITEQGGQVQKVGGEPGVGATASHSVKQQMPGLASNADNEKYDPNSMIKQLQTLRADREKALEGKLDDRQLAVIHYASYDPQAMKRMLFELDQQALKFPAQNPTTIADGQIETKGSGSTMLGSSKTGGAFQIGAAKKGPLVTEEGQDAKSVMKLFKELKKSSEFQNKRFAELERELSKPVYTRSTVRIKFPDGYMLQGAFGGLELVQAVHEFVAENLHMKDRKFTLFQALPRKVFEGALLKQTMHEAGMVPSQQMHFAWKDLPETKSEHGPFLNMTALRPFMKEL